MHLEAYTHIRKISTVSRRHSTGSKGDKKLAFDLTALDGVDMEQEKIFLCARRSDMETLSFFVAFALWLDSLFCISCFWEIVIL